MLLSMRDFAGENMSHETQEFFTDKVSRAISLHHTSHGKMHLGVLPRGYARICKDMQGYARMCKDMIGYLLRIRI